MYAQPIGLEKKRHINMSPVDWQDFWRVKTRAQMVSQQGETLPILLLVPLFSAIWCFLLTAHFVFSLNFLFAVRLEHVGTYEPAHRSLTIVARCFGYSTEEYTNHFCYALCISMIHITICIHPKKSGCIIQIFVAGPTFLFFDGGLSLVPLPFGVLRLCAKPSGVPSGLPGRNADLTKGNYMDRGLSQQMETYPKNGGQTFRNDQHECVYLVGYEWILIQTQQQTSLQDQSPHADMISLRIKAMHIDSLKWW